MTNRAAALVLAIVLNWPCALTADQQFAQELGSEPINPRLLKKVGSEKAFKPGPRGLLVTLPNDGTQAGVETRFGVDGDFEITAGYEFVEVPTPEEGYGAGVILRLNRTESEDYLATGRRRNRHGADLLNANHSRLIEGERKHDQEFYPASHARGELRVVRKGSTVTFLVREGDAVDFVTLREMQFGTESLRSVKFIADTGGSKQPVSIRLTRLAVNSGTLPYGVPRIAAPPSRNPWMIYGSSALIIGFIGAGAWYWWSRRR